MADWQVFRKRMIPLVKQPYCTIQKRGTMSFNKAAHEALGAPDAVELLYDPEMRRVGVRAIDPQAEHAYPIRDPVGKRETSFIVSGTAFTKFWDIPIGIARRYPATMEGGVLVVDLAQEGTVVTSNRNGHTKAQAADAVEVSGTAAPV